MTTNRFHMAALDEEAHHALDLVYRIVCGITAYRDTSLYDDSDVAAAWDIRCGIDYLRTPVEWVTQTHYKEPYKSKERTP